MTTLIIKKEIYENWLSLETFIVCRFKITAKVLQLYWRIRGYDAEVMEGTIENPGTKKQKQKTTTIVITNLISIPLIFCETQNWQIHHSNTMESKYNSSCALFSTDISIFFRLKDATEQSESKP